jgi:hypothetical protein
MTGPDTSSSTPESASEAAGDLGAESSTRNGGVSTVTTVNPPSTTGNPPSTTGNPESAYSDEVASSPYGATGSTKKSNGSQWTGSPYEPLPSSDADSDLTATFGYSDGTYASAEPTVYQPAGADTADTASSATPAPAAGRRTKARTRAAVISAVLGALLVAGGLYLVGEFGFRIFDAVLKTQTQPETWDIVWASTGAALLFAAVLLNGWSPWATLLPGIALTGAGIWSMVSFDGADRVATTVDNLYARPEMVVWGVTGWTLIIGLLLLGSSGAVIIARAAGRRRGRPRG